MKRSDLINIPGGIALGLLLAWLLGLFAQNPAPAPAPAAPAAAITPARPILTTVTVAHSSVAMPSAPAVPAHESAPPPAAVYVPAKGQPAGPTPDQTAQFAEVRQQSREKAMTNNLRQLASAAQQYMLDHGVTSASYYDLVGTSTDNYLRAITPVVGEDYTGVLVNQTDTQINIVAPDGTSVIYNM